MHNKIQLHLIQRCLQLAVVLLASCAIASPVKAQIVPPILVPPPRPETPTLPAPQIRPSLPPSNNLLQPPVQSSPTPGQALPTNGTGTITVQRFEVVGSTVFSSGKLAQVLAPFTKRPISFSDLYRANESVTKLYTDKGYITSGAFIPPQSLDSGVIKIQVAEGRVEKIQVTGTRRLNPNYVPIRFS